METKNKQPTETLENVPDERATRTEVGAVLDLIEQPAIVKLKKSMRERGEKARIDLDEAKKNPEVREIMAYLEKIEKISRALGSISELITIDNLNQTRTDFLQKLDTAPQNPQFGYQNSLQKITESFTQNNTDEEKIRTEINEVYEAIDQVGSAKSDEAVRVLKYALKKILRDMRYSLDLIRGLRNSDDKFVKTALEGKYGHSVRPELLTEAEKIYQKELLKNPEEKLEKVNNGLMPAEIQKAEKKASTINSTPEGKAELEALRQTDPEKAKYYFEAEEIKQAFEWTLEQYYQSYAEKTGQPFPEDKKFQVEILENCSNISVSYKKRVIKINSTRITKTQKLLQLIAHEIEGHWRQFFNAHESFGVFDGIVRADDATLVEGLADKQEREVLQTLCGTREKPEIMRSYYCMAGDLASRGADFLTVFHAIEEKQMALELHDKNKNNPEKARQDARQKAWQVSYRIFRGHIDTKNPNSYGFLKETAYLEGSLLAQDLEKNNLSHYNEAVMAQKNALPLVARFDIKPENIPLPYLHCAEKYWQEKLAQRFAQTPETQA